MALVAVRAEPAAKDDVATALGPKRDAPKVPQGLLQTAGPWILNPSATTVARRLGAAFPTVGDRWTPQLGVKTGANELFLVGEPGPYARPAIRGRDVDAWCAEPSTYLLWTHGADGRPLPRLPAAVVQLLEPHFERLRRRADYHSGAPWQLFRTALASAPHRVLWPDLARKLTAVVPLPDVVPLNTVYGIATRTGDDAHALAALFNSRWLTALARLRADPARGGYRRFNARVVRELPVPPGDSPAWTTLAACGRRCESDEGVIADVFQLDASDRRALARAAPPADPV